MPIIGVRPTREFKEFLACLRRQIEHFGEIEVTDLAFFCMKDAFHEVSISPLVMEQHITEVLKGNQTPMLEEEYRTHEEALHGEAKKIGLSFTRRQDRASFLVRCAVKGE